MAARQPRLYVLPASHYCERARWALDLSGVAYSETCWAIGPHVPLARRLAPATTLPILDTGREIIQGSGRIMDWTGLAGDDPDLERRFEDRIGVLVRQYLYSATLGESRSLISALVRDGAPAWQAGAARAMWPVTRRAMIERMNARPSMLTVLAVEIEAELAWFEEQMDGRGYLRGNAIGRADITAASLLAPLARPDACPLYRSIVLPAVVETTLAIWSGQPSIKWVLRLYENERYRARRS